MSTSILASSTIISTIATTIPTRVEYDVDILPRHAAVLLYVISVLYGVIYGCLTWFSHRGSFKRKLYFVFFVFSVFNITISGIATILSIVSFDGKPVEKNIWGAHFNITTDIVSAIGALVGFGLVAKETHWTTRYTIRGGSTENRALWISDCRIFIISILVLVLSLLGFLSSLSSIYNLSKTDFSKIGGWYVGFVCWIVGSFLFIIGEFDYIGDMFHGVRR
jgi:hypothetical protein